MLGQHTRLALAPPHEDQRCLIMDVCRRHDAEVEDAMAVEGQVEGARLPSLRHTSGIDGRTSEVDNAHEHVKHQSFLEQRDVIMNCPLVYHRHDPEEAEADKDASTNKAETDSLKHIHKADHDGRCAKERDRPEVKVLPSRGAHEAVVNRREVGRNDEERDAHVVKTPDEASHVGGAAAKEVADGGGQETSHSPSKEDVDGPARDLVGQRLRHCLHLRRNRHRGEHYKDGKAKKMAPDIEGFVVHAEEAVNYLLQCPVPWAVVPCGPVQQTITNTLLARGKWEYGC